MAPSVPAPGSRAGVVLVALLAVLAGCGGAGGPASPTADTPTPPESTATTPSPTPTPGPAGIDGRELARGHVDRLEAAGSFTRSLTIVRRRGDRTVSVNTTTAVDLARDRGFERSRLRSSASDRGATGVETYSTANVTYRRLELGVGDGSITQYEAGTPPYEGNRSVTPVNVTGAMHASLVASVGEEVSWRDRGRTTWRGVDVRRYTASGTDRFGETIADQIGQSNATVTEIRATLLVDARGGVRSFRLAYKGTAEGAPVELSYVIRFTDVGSTQLEAPEWLDEARARTTAG